MDACGADEPKLIDCGVESCEESFPEKKVYLHLASAMATEVEEASRRI